ncbi:MAG: c-type cytochrome [Burkholderiales bacterium]|nr:c-type cytochrome [Burkholderiales bacterium]MDE2431982.1 c-type cytochrome [Burkholderiales bacterium]
MRKTTRTAVRLLGLAAVSATVLAGCAIEWTNRQPAKEMAQLATPPGSIYTGWRVFQEKCASCHGSSGQGTDKAPNLLMRVQAMGPKQFISVVLKRYDWGLPAARVKGDTATMDTLVESILERKEGAVEMRAWEGEPRVTAHIADLYAYLSARADGRQGEGRPNP